MKAICKWCGFEITDLPDENPNIPYAEGTKQDHVRKCRSDKKLLGFGNEEWKLWQKYNITHRVDVNEKGEILEHKFKKWARKIN